MNDHGLRELLRSESFTDVLHQVNECQVSNPDLRARQVGKRIKQRLNAKLVADFREPIEIDDLTVGYLALLYEAEKGAQIEQELGADRDITERVKSEG